jgi:hypothetical protein
MRVSIIVTDDDGNTFQGDADLSARRQSKSAPMKKKSTSEKATHVAATVSLSSPIRPFIKKHARDMGGPQKFTLLLAHMVKGDTKKEVALATIQKQWGKMKVLLGKWNGAHTIRAKEHEWVDSPKTGMYVLLSGWKGIFNA